MAEVILLTVALTAFFVRLFYKSREKDLIRNFNREISAKTEAYKIMSQHYKKDSSEHYASQLKIIKEDLQEITNDSSQSYPWLSKLFADYYFIQDQAFISQIRTNPNIKSTAAEVRKQLMHDNRDLRIQNKMYEYQLHFYETIFPWLEEFKELSPQDAYASQILVDDKSEYETLRSWLSPEEYNSLSSSQKFQLALDRYQRRSKTKWEIGIEYERYIGYLCEQQGYHVTYTGATLGLEDMGRDLVLSNGNKRIVIQCKRWAQEKTIHEKHIFQLFGSCILLEQQHPGMSVSGVFVTTANLSETARACASRLNILIYENIPMQDYPVIKCNVSRSGEKIYHLPFDQQYDRILIEPDKGEFYAGSVASAEVAGFRRALRHNPNNS